MCNGNRTLIREQQGFTSWCSNTGCIRLCFGNLILFMCIEEMKDFMNGLFHATGIEKEDDIDGHIAVYILPTPLHSIELAFTPNEQQYLLGLCQRSILLAEKMVLSN